jgi:hypothetical protein
MSIVELRKELNKYVHTSYLSTVKSTLLNLLTLVIETSEDENQIRNVLQLVGTDLKKRADVVKLLCSKPKVAKALAQIIGMHLTFGGISGGGAKEELIFESGHPYDNNMRHEETIRIPGATKLMITFDAQCKSENGCDYLAFYSD